LGVSFSRADIEKLIPITPEGDAVEPLRQLIE